MEIIPEGKNFRLVHDDELPEIMVFLERYLPEALKVKCVYKLCMQMSDFSFVNISEGLNWNTILLKCK